MGCGAAVLLFLAACSSLVTKGPAPVPAGFPADPSAPALADEAWVDEARFFIRFWQGGDVVFAGGSWADRIDLRPADGGENFTGPYILPLQYEQPEPWDDRPAGPQPVTILGVLAWREFRNRLFADLIPRDGQGGLVVYFGTDDYFLYYDATGTFHAIPLHLKPGEYRVASALPFAAVMARGIPLLRDYLTERGVVADRVGFNTGDHGDFALPFLYVNVARGIAVFIRREPPAPPADGIARVLPWLRTGTHMVESQVTGLPSRPFSSVYRLFFMATDTLGEALRPDWLASLGLDGDVPPLNTGPGMDLAVWEKRLDRLTGRPASAGSIEYLVDGEAFFTAFLDAVSAARASITLRMYIFDDDDFAVKVADALRRRAEDGVDVRVLLDGLGTTTAAVEQNRSLPPGHGPPASMKAYLESGSRVRVRMADNPWFTGDHAKTVVIDGERAFMGGMNIGREYRYEWHDLMVGIRGPVVGEIARAFDKAWAHAGWLGDFAYPFAGIRAPVPPASPEDRPLRLLYTQMHNAEIYGIQRDAIRSARRYIHVQNPYFTHDALLAELLQARRRGVDVRVILPLVTDRGPITRNNILAANFMFEHGIRVFVYPGMSHVKAAVFDGWACLGSANWDRLSLRINKEVNIATADAATVADLEARLFAPDFARAVEMTEPFPTRWQDYLAERFGDYLF
jgi:cardiolipin synthase